MFKFELCSNLIEDVFSIQNFQGLHVQIKVYTIYESISL
jgi:hypothetical protein